MMSKSKITRFLILSSAALCLVFINGVFNETNAQRDPFSKNPKLVKRTPRSPSSSPDKEPVKKEPVKPKGPVVVNAPPIDQRIAYFMSMREQAALNGQPLPKVTSVLTLQEMSVIGIFKTPRGFAAMVEAEPIKLSYTIYPGEKFFDGQLVAVEENRLVFRKITKMSNNKFLSTVENKTLREYKFEQEIQGTAPVGSSGSSETASNSQPAGQPAADETKTDNPAPSMIISPLDEMNNQKDEEPEESTKKKPNKKTKVARRP
jgi:hypothetical protein